MTHKKQQHSNTFNKYSLVIWIIAIASIAIAGYSWFGGRSSIAGSCGITRNTNAPSGSCGMMGNRKSVQTQKFVSQQELSPSAQQADPQAQVITMNYNESGLTPTTVNVKIGQKYKIIINANTSVYGCMNAITLPGLDDNLQQVVEGSKIIFNITPTKAGSYDFVCGMGVPHGASVIVQ